jgi:hypothetical protein
VFGSDASSTRMIFIVLPDVTIIYPRRGWIMIINEFIAGIN